MGQNPNTQQELCCLMQIDLCQASSNLFSYLWLILFSIKIEKLLLLSFQLLLWLWRYASDWVHRRTHSLRLNTMTGSSLPQYGRDRTQSTVEINKRTFPVGDHRHLHTTQACFVNRKAYHSQHYRFLRVSWPWELHSLLVTWGMTQRQSLRLISFEIFFNATGK
jgi:hypothetical protein